MFSPLIRLGHVLRFEQLRCLQTNFLRFQSKCILRKATIIKHAVKIFIITNSYILNKSFLIYVKRRAATVDLHRNAIAWRSFRFEKKVLEDFSLFPPRNDSSYCVIAVRRFSEINESGFPCIVHNRFTGN